MYKCEHCKVEFEKFKVIRGNLHTETTPPSREPDYMGCPFCGDTDINQYCECCKKLFDTNEIKDGLCCTCRGQAEDLADCFNGIVGVVLKREQMPYFKQILGEYI